MESRLSENFEKIKNIPEELSKLISKYVEINLVKNTVLKGFISSVDPVTHSLILMVQRENKKGTYQTVLIPGHAVLDVTVMDSEMLAEVPRLFSTPSVSTNNNERKEKLMEWFRSNLLQVNECDDNILFGNVTILPPYNIEDICTDNPIIAMQVQRIMEKMPNNFSNNQITTS